MSVGAVVAAGATPAVPAGRTRRIRVMQLTDHLEPGGKERVAVNLGNLLPRDRFESYFCTTRGGGPLERFIAPDVDHLRLARRHAADWPALRRLVSFNARRHIDILHAHGSSLFVASLASMFPPFPAVVWHDHYGPYRSDDRPVLLYRCAATRVSAVIAVNRPLAAWSRTRLNLAADRVWYIPNFATEAAAGPAKPVLPGAPGSRIVCVAHLRPQKDHATLVQAFAAVASRNESAHLLIVGAEPDAAYAAGLRRRIEALGLERRVSLLGQRDDVPQILAQCDIGVLSSASEGFPLSLVEYGQAGLAVLSTRVGECPEVLDDGRAGLLVPPGHPDRLADALMSLLRSPWRRRTLAAALRGRVRTLYRSGPIVDQICHVYDAVIGFRAPGVHL